MITVPVEWEVRAGQSAAAFSYLPDPPDVTRRPGYPDPPLCTPLPLPGFSAPPQPGASYVDPNFGGRVRVMTGAPIYHTYSTPSPLSAHQQVPDDYPENGTWEIVDAATARVVFRREPCNQSYFWDADDDEVYYYFRAPPSSSTTCGPIRAPS